MNTGSASNTVTTDVPTVKVDNGAGGSDGKNVKIQTPSTDNNIPIIPRSNSGILRTSSSDSMT